MHHSTPLGSDGLDIFKHSLDLLVHGVQPPVNLDVREEQSTGIVVVGLSQPKVTCAEQILGLIALGNATRTQGATGIA